MADAPGDRIAWPGGDLAATVLAVERAFATAATSGAAVVIPAAEALVPGCLGAVASRYLAIGTPRTLGVITVASGPIAAASVAAHATWFAPREIRWVGPDPVAGARVTSVEEALACDIVCVHAPIAIRAAQLRRGTHLNVLDAGATIDADLRQLATVFAQSPGLGQLAAGLVDGRQLDELTVFVI